MAMDLYWPTALQALFYKRQRLLFEPVSDYFRYLVQIIYTLMCVKVWKETEQFAQRLTKCGIFTLTDSSECSRSQRRGELVRHAS